MQRLDTIPVGQTIRREHRGKFARTQRLLKPAAVRYNRAFDRQTRIPKFLKNASTSCGDFSSRRIHKDSAVVQGADFLWAIAFTVKYSQPGKSARFTRFRQSCRFSIRAGACKHFARDHLAVNAKNQYRAHPVGLLKRKQARRNSPPNSGKGRRLGILQCDDKLACAIRRHRIRGSYAFPQRLRNPRHEFFCRKPSIPLTKHSEVLHFDAHSHRAAGQSRPLYRATLASRNRSVRSIRADSCASSGARTTAFAAIAVRKVRSNVRASTNPSSM